MFISEYFKSPIIKELKVKHFKLFCNNIMKIMIIYFITEFKFIYIKYKLISK